MSWQVTAPPPAYLDAAGATGPPAPPGPPALGAQLGRLRQALPVETEVPVERTTRTRAVLGLFALVFGATLVWSIALRAFDLRPPGLPLAIGFKLASAAVGLACAARLGWLQRCGFRGPSRWSALWLAWLPVGYVLLAAAGLRPADGLSGGTALGIALLCFAIGLDEEVWFRGLVLESLRHRGTQVAVLASGLLFGLVHAVNALGANPVATAGQVVFASCFGVCLGAVRVRTGSIWPAIALHALWDLVQLLHAGGLPDGDTSSPALPVVLAGTLLIGSPLLVHGLVLSRPSVVCGPDGLLPRLRRPAGEGPDQPAWPAPRAPRPATWVPEATPVGPWPDGGRRPPSTGWSWDGAAFAPQARRTA